MNDLATARSLLFVPGTRPERFQKAVDAGADAIVVDLEDAVAPSEKDTAREHVDNYLAGGGRAVVRINAHDTPWHRTDLQMVGRHGCPVMIPKAESGDAIRAVRKFLREDTPLIPLIESAAAVMGAGGICEAEGVIRVAFGSFDLAAELGIAPEERSAFVFARSAIVLASAAAKISPPLDGVTGSVANIDLLSSDIAHGRAMGFGGKLCIHPNQVDTVNVGFSVTQEDLLWAGRVLDAAGNDGVAVVDGRMVDAPVLARARRLMAMHRT